MSSYDDAEDLDAIPPAEAMEMWLDRQQSEKADETLQSYRYRIKHFVEWCEEHGIDTLDEFGVRDLLRYDSERRGEELAQNTLNNQLGTLRQFLDFCERFNLAEEGLPKRLELPELTQADRRNEEKLSADRAEVIRDDLSRYRRASRDHALFEIAWHTAARLGGLRSLDVEDVYLDADDIERIQHQDDVPDSVIDEVRLPFLYFRHRADDGSPLKNKIDGERPVALSDDVAGVIREYLDVGRAPITDDYGRRPLFPTESGGRISKGGIRARMNIVTQPCRFGADCPHGREIATCEARDHGYESRCPSSRSPHRVRTGAITYHLDQGWPIDALAERVNATPQVIREHYDQPEQLRRMETRRSYLDDMEDDS